MAYKVIILYQLYMPSYFLGTFTEYPYKNKNYWDLHTLGYTIRASPDFTSKYLFPFNLPQIKKSQF